MRFGFQQGGRGHHQGGGLGHHQGGGRSRHALRGADFRGGFGGGLGDPERDDRTMRGRRRRVYDSGELRLVLLRLIADEPRHGYDLIRAIETRTGGAYAPSPGVVYPTLTMLGDMEHIVELPGEGTRKVFGLTDSGRALLDEKAQEIAGLIARLDALAAAGERTGGVAIRRATHNLKMVLYNRLGEPEVSVDTIHAVVALIDEAARAIERL